MYCPLLWQELLFLYLSQNKLSVVSEMNNYKDPEPVVIDILRILGYGSALRMVIVQNDKNEPTVLEDDNIMYDAVNKVHRTL